ncbi:5-(carboxyamino)imidazole ribonucleotide synthase [Bartonella sp. DGB1]|uniref:5-(carboxyamino)imidazole ribonucleotide synthase n=1 Tax=Bartonella sp. DGB1 TaxID=3239807 RepID=UPI0035256CE9
MHLKHIGIIGGGQLARMLAMAALRLGCKITIVDPQENAPAKNVATEYICANYDDSHALEKLAKNCDIITYEFENVSVKALSKVSCPIYPSVRALEISQDRYVEKNFFNSINVKTADFVAIDSLEQLQKALIKFNGDAILKTRRFGYDGHGQYRFTKDAVENIAELWSKIQNTPLILEKIIPFKKEISIIAARNLSGEISLFDIAENIHEHGILRKSSVPANIDADVVKLVNEIAIKLLTKLNYVGVLAIEFFLLENGELLVNEFAPRVHNSGHWTEAACCISQFEQHIRAILDLPLLDPGRHSDCVMKNILGDEINHIANIFKQPNIFINIYGKEEIKTKRKMGHFTELKSRLS